MRLPAWRALLLALLVLVGIAGQALAQVGIEERVRDTTTTSGTGTYTLAASPPTGSVAFATAFTSGSTVRYVVTDGTRWEVATGVFTSPATLTRVVVEASSNSNSSVNWPDNTSKTVFVAPSARDLTYHLPNYVGTSAGSANAQTLSPPVVLRAYRAGHSLSFKAGYTNTGALTLNVSALGTRNVYKPSAAGPVALTGGEVVANQIVRVIDDGTQYLLIAGQTPTSSRICGVVSSAGNNADNLEKDLMTCSMAASSLINSGGLVRITAWGTLANNSHVKQVKLYFGSTGVAVIPATAGSNVAWRAVLEVTRTGSNAQQIVYHGMQGSAVVSTISATSATETETNAITLKVTGQVTTGATSANDVVATAMIAELLPRRRERGPRPPARDRRQRPAGARPLRRAA